MQGYLDAFTRNYIILEPYPRPTDASYRTTKKRLERFYTKDKTYSSSIITHSDLFDVAFCARNNLTS